MSASTITVRAARGDDLDAVVAIYNAGIAERVATFETRPRRAEELAGWTSDGQPFVVAEADGRVVGWARAAPYSDRCVYDCLRAYSRSLAAHNSCEAGQFLNRLAFHSKSSQQ